MFSKLEEINTRPEVFGVYTAASLWSDDYRAKQMLAYHLNESIDVSSRNHEFIEQSVQWIVKKFSINERSNVCDFGCGPGLYTSRIAGHGAQVTGIDFSGNSIQYARQQAEQSGLAIHYIQDNYLNVSLTEQYDLITMIMCDLCALSPQQRQSLFLKFRELLADNGRILLDVYSINFFNQKEEAAVYEKNQLHHFWYKEDYYCFCNSYKYQQEKVLLDKYSLFSETGQTDVVYNWLQCFDVNSLKSELETAGLKINSLYADVSGNEYDSNSAEFAVIIEKA